MKLSTSSLGIPCVPTQWSIRTIGSPFNPAITSHKLEAASNHDSWEDTSSAKMGILLSSAQSRSGWTKSLGTPSKVS
eukprot:CAMPEP_0197277032 /NCGR_PEP_ID=MMETSP1432-20130617/16409_1 /TAXON_ID=44447 /ORGANISM="Pseudo-nitzschia delicatissima, Strain UNC1205" /LENGTH=76 /DNA_ID=CAMNT_0042743179 /DNA_START=24 /DNA_END=254 /DNA_ORIENTATION=-